jgi:hypothetical protein
MRWIGIRKSIILWILLVLVALLDNTAYSINRHFHYTDLLLITSVVLVLRGRLITSLVFTAAAAVFHDAFFLPFSGYSVFSSLSAFLIAAVLSVSLYKDNFSTQVVIIGVCCLVKEATAGLLAFIFYTSMKVYLFPVIIIFLKVLMTTIVGAAAVKLIDADYGKAAGWLKIKTIFSRG